MIKRLATRRKIEVATVAIFIALILVISTAYTYWETLPSAVYKIGDEIKGFPVDGISMTITNFMVSQTNLPFPNSSKVVLNVTIHNLADYTVYFNQSSFETKFDQSAANKHLELTYKTAKGGGGGAYPPNYSNWWGITMSGATEFNSLTANERINGSMVYVLTPDSYSSFGLVCKSTSEQKPLFIVNLAQG
jgi:hypothetical protein